MTGEESAGASAAMMNLFRRALTITAGLCAGCLAASTPSSRPTEQAREGEVLLDLVSACPRLSTDGAGHTFFAAMTDKPSELGVQTDASPGLVVGERRGGSVVWHRSLGGVAVSFVLAEGRNGEGMAVAGVASAALPLGTVSQASPGPGLFVVSFAADGTQRFSRWVAAPEGSRITAAVLGPHAEVTIVGTARAALDLGAAGRIEPEPGAYDDTIAFVLQYATDGSLARHAMRAAKLGTTPRLAAWSDGRLALAFDAQDRGPTLEMIDPAALGSKTGHRPAVDFAGPIRAVAAAFDGDVMVATQAAGQDSVLTSTILRLSRTGELQWTRAMRGELQDGAFGVRANGDTWFGGWFDALPPGCTGPARTQDGGALPRLQIIGADGKRCRSVPVATRDARWNTPASLVDVSEGHIVYATPWLGSLALPGLAPRSAGSVGSRCIVLDLPADAPAYRP